MLSLVRHSSACLVDAVVIQDIPLGWIGHDGDGWSERQGDCDDTSSLLGPCDGIDNGCDTKVDSGVNASTITVFTVTITLTVFTVASNTDSYEMAARSSQSLARESDS